ncbi:hypothetical protein E4U41_006172 [Claviceps citrina]|nr:hypothetical protein E4U41_006172 [Claviceps citrina]
MARIARMRRLASLQWTAPAPLPTTRPPSFFATGRRAISTTCATRGKNTDWVREKLWKGEAPGPEDPYTQRPEPELAEDDAASASNLPEEALRRPRRDKTPAAVLKSRLTLPPRRSEAVPEKEAASVDPSYVPATTAEGLEETGTLKTWWDQDGHWGEESEFRGFGSPDRVVDRHVMEVCLRQSVVEALALRETRGSPPAEWATSKWREVSRAELQQILAAEVLVQDDGQASLKGDSAFISQSLLMPEAEAEPEGAGGAGDKITPDEAREMVRAWARDASWKELVLDEPLKFAIRKRLYQLTGTLIPDAKLGAARTVKHVLTLVSKKPLARKLADVLEQRIDVQQLANLKVHSRKIGLIEKETLLGRWKVIEGELTRRGLPVTGTAGLSKNKERDWITGKL